MATQPNAYPDSKISMTQIGDLGDRLEDLMNRAKQALFVPNGVKVPPSFNAAQVAALCDKTPDQFARMLDKAQSKGLPDGVAVREDGQPSRIKSFTLEETRKWVAASKHCGKPSGSRAAVVSIGNFKGGVGKTVLTMSLAQGLSLLGYKVLCIDYDPQGSLSSLFGLTPSEIPEEQTIMPLMVPRNSSIASDTLQGSIVETYWDGVALVPASHALFSAEFYLPLRQMNAHKANSTEPDFLFYRTLSAAIEKGLASEFDFILTDTPPALSYTTMTAFWASDAILMPLPPEGLDFASSAQFWSMLADVTTGTISHESEPKTYDWIGVVPSKVDNVKSHTPEILQWMKAGYGSMMLNSEIPETAAVKVGGASLQTIYDISRYTGSQKTLQRARDAFDKVVKEVEFLTRTRVWGLED